MEIGDMLQIRPTLDPSAGLGTTAPQPHHRGEMAGNDVLPT